MRNTCGGFSLASKLEYEIAARGTQRRKMKSTISRDGSNPFNLCDGEAWNKTIVAPSGSGMSLTYVNLANIARGSGTCFVYDKGLTSKFILKENK